ncbi:hypothetical protein EIN_118240 [Entamoeba invadens IP1]|uniref:Uncharacterized protein n=1 Tax=Entamoeba invadens IP1 TaxID=370355 RepID=L7FPX8_ENTIV|nr:hypothetical protein EIN_118240 [Entamoeba invadens IP1]ELP92250.1 hypothetical protein EIN_118240 [Entamoeba invadens IP1]|eukprot:XP_004259021.1 hypothetical protein EIN_118240 [Entamoeba invadens IP1]
MNKRGRKKKAITIEDTRTRKRANRVNANRNDYGNEGFLMMIFYYLGCEITLKRTLKEGKFQKLKIESLTFNNVTLLDRNTVEEDIKMSKLLTDDQQKKRRVIAITIDNMLLDLLRQYFGFTFQEVVKKKPENAWMPERRILEHISLDREWNKLDIIEEGVVFYDNLKLYGRKMELIHLSQSKVFNYLSTTSIDVSESSNTVS